MSLTAFTIKLERIDEELLYRDPGGGVWLSCICTLDTDAKGRHVVAQSIPKERYAAGEKVSYSDISHAKKASGCWAGTTEDAATLKVVVKKVTVMGNMGPVKGSIAFAKTTQDYLPPMQPTWDGVLGSQDVFGCGPEA